MLNVVSIQMIKNNPPSVPGINCPSLGGNATTCAIYELDTPGGGDSNTYDATLSIDANNHVTESMSDVLGNTRYVRYDSGVYGGTLTPNELIAMLYNVLNEPTSVTTSDLLPQSGQNITSATASMQYDNLGRLTQLSDPDAGTHTYAYDADSRLTSDVVGSLTLGYNYDLLGRLGCLQDAAPPISANATGACTGGNPYIQNTYDTSVIGGSSDYPKGQLTKSIASTYFPEGGSATVTEKFAHDQRGRLFQENLLFSLPSSWGVSTPLPTYILNQTYTDADQPQTTTTSSASPSGLGYTSTQIYDGTNGGLLGLSNNTNTTTPNLASIAYTVNAQVGTIAFQTSSGSALANEQYGYDGDLRPTSMTTTWQGGSGQSGTILSQAIGYDPASNVINVTSSQAVVPGYSNSGGTETQIFCYDEQGRLVWSGNTGTLSCSGNGTPGVSGSISGYTNTFVYTHLGQLWQGPLNGGRSQYQYLYCDSSHPHQLTGLYAIGAVIPTCSNKTGQGYASTYDPSSGTVKSRTFSGTTGKLSYNNLNHMVEWNAGSTDQEWYLYDASGNRVLRRSTNSSSTTMTVYPFGLEEHLYSGSGSNQFNTYYYSLGGQLIGDLNPNSTYFLLTDALGSVVSTINWSAGGASVQGNQLFGPYGNGRYYAGNLTTTKGFTGQYNDGLTGLDYFHARYYDPVAGVFLAPDVVQGNAGGMNSYGYVGGNPETSADPSGQKVISEQEPPPPAPLIPPEVWPFVGPWTGILFL